MRRANRGSLEEENDQHRARCIIPGVQEHESAQRAVAREDGVTRQNENNQQRSRRNAPGAVEHESTQRAAAREDGVTRQNENNQ